jgi:chaperonin GroES
MESGGKQLIVVGDRVLIRQEKPEDRTQVGLYLPQSVLEKENVQGGRIVSIGPGIAIPSPTEHEEEEWRRSAPQNRYIPMQAREGDYALFLRKEGVEIKFEGQKYIIVPQNAVLVLIREDGDAAFDELSGDLP